MGIFIRSQDKLYLINADTLWIEYVKQKNDYVIINPRFTLGRYSTKEKALKVLDMIQEHISGQTMAEEFNLPFYNIQEVKEKLNKNRIFQMPKDDEVK